MFDPKTLYFTSGAMMAMMTLLCFLTWRTNKNIPGTATYTLYRFDSGISKARPEVVYHLTSS